MNRRWKLVSEQICGLHRSCSSSEQRGAQSSRCRGRAVDFPVLEMKFPTCVYLSWTLLSVAVVPLSVGEMYTSLLNVKQAISVERKLIDYLRTYIDHEVDRLEDIKR